jgi:uncharacterized protein (TIGR02594 family)
LEITALGLAQRFLGLAEVPGVASDPQILAMLRRDASWPAGDDVPWCSAFAGHVCWLLDLPRPRSRSLAARSWLTVGRPVPLDEARPGFDVVVLRRGHNSPGPEVLEAPGHVGFFAGDLGDDVLVLGGNQSDAVSVARFPSAHVLGVRRLLG